ncbi:MAG TPA: amidohydrolase family protein [Conexibacter sp.]|nr:amidohydrolase family protein [Conexibacter sp.]
MTIEGSRLTAPEVVLQDAALADGRGPRLAQRVSVLVRDGRIAGLWQGEPDLAGLRDVVAIDASGATLVPGLVDMHGHVALSGGARHRDRLTDDTETMLRVAEENGTAAFASGVRWIRDLGSSMRTVDGAAPAPLAVTLRDRWRARADRPVVVAGSTWITCPGYLGDGVGIDAPDGGALPALALAQLETGADFVKLYLEGPTPEACPWTVEEVARAVKAVHAEGRKVAVHAVSHAAAQVAAAAGVDTLDHGFELDDEIARTMAGNGVALVTTLSALRAFCDYGTLAPWTRHGPLLEERREQLRVAGESVGVALAAGVTVVAGSDQGGGSVRAGHLALELELLVQAGMSPVDALAAVTWRAGEVLGIPAAGRIEVGEPATFLLVHGNPLEDPSALWRVWLRAGA